MQSQFETFMDLARNAYSEAFERTGCGMREGALRAAVAVVLMAAVPKDHVVVCDEDLVEALSWLEATAARLSGSIAAEEIDALIARIEPLVRPMKGFDDEVLPVGEQIAKSLKELEGR